MGVYVCFFILKIL